MATSLPTRLVICVDGTWCTADGPQGRPHENLSNVYRVCAGVKGGECVDSSGKRFYQRKHYIAGIGSDNDIAWLERLQTGAFGVESLAQIRDIYERCCMLTSNDEVWLYGFSRGAYIVRAVAGLLHYLRALTSAGTPAFKEDYSNALKLYDTMQYRVMQKHSRLGPGQIHNYLSSSTREAPKIRFIGAFDTVKAVNDKSLYDISFNPSIHHLRHALALNENRKAMTPEYLFPNLGRLPNRSFIQAWFLGAHIDMGGSAKNDGLALYPLQWMLLESQSKGLVLEFDGSLDQRVSIDNPLSIVFPKNDETGESYDLWSCNVKNGLTIAMQDLRRVHGQDKYNNRYAVRLNRHNPIYMIKKPREPFTVEGHLKGYCDDAPQGTIVHPSVYLIFDEYSHILLDSKDLDYRHHIEQMRSIILYRTQDFWNDYSRLEIEEPGAVRILVCGNTGVGKSTLINKVFGVEITGASDREAGRHDVNEAFTTPDRPDMIIHDSNGFETGGAMEIQKVQDFVVQHSAIPEIKDRLHIIWFCLELNSARTKQTATVELFKTISRYAQNVPIVVITTKKDEFIAIKKCEAMQKVLSTDKTISEYLDALDEYAQGELRDRMKLIEKELLEIEHGRFDATVVVSERDENSISVLSEETSRCLTHERVRLLYIAAQVSRIDLKVDLAISGIMRIYKRSINRSAALHLIPAGASTTRVTLAKMICKIIVTSFGVPMVGTSTILGIVKKRVWDDMNYDRAAIWTAEVISSLGVLGTVATFGMPIFLASAAVNTFLVVPAQARGFLMLACDLILILTRAFEESIKKCIGHPQEKEIENAAIAYRKISRKVHKQIEKLIPKTHLIKSFQDVKVRLRFEQIIEEFKDRVRGEMEED